MKPSTVTLASALGLLLVAATVATPGAALGALTGEGPVSVIGCPAEVAEFHGTNVAGATWRFDVGFGCANPKLIFIGGWDPAGGGCVPGISIVGQFCVGPTPQGIPAFTGITLCYEEACNGGTGVVLRA